MPTPAAWSKPCCSRHDWLAREKPDVAVVVYNDHGLNFFLDNLPTFAVGAAPLYSNADEGWGLPTLAPYPGDPRLSWHIIESLVNEEFASPEIDITPKSGYAFQLTAGAGAVAGAADCTGQPTRSAYYFRAEPLSTTTGKRGFATNHVGTIWQDTSGVAPAEPFTTSATVSPLDSH